MDDKLYDFFRWASDGLVHYRSDLKHIPDICFHLTPKDRIDSILKNGLVPGSPRFSQEGISRGIYLTADINLLSDDAMDSFCVQEMCILTVDVSSFKHLLIPDPEWRSHNNDKPEHCEEDMCWYVLEKIDPKLIKVEK